MWIKPPLDPTNPVNALYEFTTGQHEAFFPSPFPPSISTEHGIERMVEYDRIRESKARIVSTVAKYLSSTFVSDEFFQKLDLWKIDRFTRSTHPRLLSALVVSKYHALHRQVRR